MYVPHAVGALLLVFLGSFLAIAAAALVIGIGTVALAGVLVFFVLNVLWAAFVFALLFLPLALTAVLGAGDAGYIGFWLRDRVHAARVGPAWWRRLIARITSKDEKADA